MKRIISACILAAAMGFGAMPVVAQGTACDSPCKMTYLPLIRRIDAPVPNSNPLAELQGKVGGVNRVSGASQAYFEYQADEQARPQPDSPMPVYPTVLKERGVEGEVVATFVVNTSGAVELPTFTVVRSTDSLFVSAVRAALPAMRFLPARADSKNVRQLVQQSFPFKLPH